MPLPGETALIAAGIFASRGRLDIAAVIAVAAIAAIVGDNIGYWIGRTGGRRLLDRWGRVTRVSERALPWAEEFFRRHGAKTIFLARFFSVLRVTAAWMAGVSRMHWLDVLRLERRRRDLLGPARRARRLLRRPRARRRDLPLRADRRRRDRRLALRGLRRLPRLAQAARGVAVKRAALLVALVVCSVGQAAPPPVPAFDHVVVVVLENKSQRPGARQPRRARLQRLRAQGRGPGRLSRRDPSEPAELPRARLRLDARDHERLHELHRRRAQPRRHARGAAPDLEDLRRRAAAAGLDRAVARPLREEARAVSLLPPRARRARAPAADRAADAALARPRGGSCRTSRSSSRTSATTCTTARSRPATPG